VLAEPVSLAPAAVSPGAGRALRERDARSSAAPGDDLVSAEPVLLAPAAVSPGAVHEPQGQDARSSAVQAGDRVRAQAGLLAPVAAQPREDRERRALARLAPLAPVDALVGGVRGDRLAPEPVHRNLVRWEDVRVSAAPLASRVRAQLVAAVRVSEVRLLQWPALPAVGAR